MHRVRSALPALASLLVCSSFWTTAHADWPALGAPITRVTGDEQYPFTMAADGMGGAYFSWSSTTDIAARLTGNGEHATGWGDGGLRFGGPTSMNIRCVADGIGGCYFLFNAKDCVAHCGVDPSQRRVIRMGPSGTPSASWRVGALPVATLWGPVGVGASDAGQTDAIADGTGGLLVGWGQHVGDRRGPVELRVQRVGPTGIRVWGDSGVVVRPQSTVLPRVALAADGHGGSIAGWTDERSPGFFAQRISSTGSLEWQAAGVALADERVGFASPPLATPDGAGGALFVWFGSVGGDSGIFAVRVNASGHLPWRRPLCVLRASAGIDGLQLAASRAGDVIVVWRDAREAGNETIHAQRVGRGGRLEWPRGAVVCGARGHKAYVAATSDGADGAYIAWGDTRPEGEVFAMHLDRDGESTPGWRRDGNPICPPVAAVWQVSLAGDGNGGAVLAWADERLPTTGRSFRVTQAMRLLPHGAATPIGDAARFERRNSPREPANETRAFGSLELRAASPGPPATATLVQFVLPDASSASLELYDLSGRRLWSRDVGPLGAGSHTVRLADGAWLPPGVYFARLTRGLEAATVRVTTLH
ncbi:MAG: T9SS type A sorting domain-containing protein [Candidatus Eisenbacteria bacterium]